jgi:hypothetical protein
MAGSSEPPMMPAPPCSSERRDTFISMARSNIFAFIVKSSRKILRNSSHGYVPRKQANACAAPASTGCILQPPGG